ncbi:MAG: hypothetical protein WBD95_13440 [Xanthobacteraceae bacterium]
MDKRDEQIAALQADIEKLKQKHAEDKFIWTLGGIVVFDTFAFSHIGNWSGPIVIGLVELIFILIFATRCDVDIVATLIDKIIGGISSLRGDKTEE